MLAKTSDPEADHEVSLSVWNLLHATALFARLQSLPSQHITFNPQHFADPFSFRSFVLCGLKQWKHLKRMASSWKKTTNGDRHLASCDTWRATQRGPTRQTAPYLWINTTLSILIAMTSNQEQSIQNALNDVESKRFRSIQQAAAYHKVAPSTLGHRRRGRQTWTSIDLNS